MSHDFDAELYARLRALKEHIESEVNTLLTDYDIQSVAINVDNNSRMTAEGDEIFNPSVRIKASTEIVYSV